MGSPVAYHPDALPLRWPGGEPLFPVDAAFYLAVQRAELAHLAHHANTFHDLHRDGEPPPELQGEVWILANEIWDDATGLTSYDRAWSPRDNPEWPSEAPRDWNLFEWSIRSLVVRLGGLRNGRTTPIEFAHRASTPGMLALYRLMLSRAPDLRIDPEGFTEPPEAPPVPEGFADAAGGPEPAARPEATPETTTTLEDIADALERGRKRTAARLVRYMAVRESAAFEDIATAVHDDESIGCSAIRTNVTRTNAELEALAAPFRFKCASSKVYREPAAAT